MTTMIGRTRSHGAGAATVFAGLVLAGCSGPARTTRDAAAAPIPVTVATVAMTDVADTFEAGGVVQARTTATITARIQAPVVEVRVAPADRVRAGQTMIVLDGSDLAAHARSARAAAVAADQAVAAAAADQQAADAALLLARATHERIAGLQSRRSATAQELDDATAALRAAEAHATAAAARARSAASLVDSARAASEGAATTASFASITAPFDGVVTEKMIEPGNMASPGQPLLRLEDTAGFRLDVRVDESRIGQITRGATVPVSLDAGPGGATLTLRGTVSDIGRAVDAGARAFLVKVTLPVTAGLRSGTFGRAHFGAASRRALTVPAEAVVRRGQMTSVLVVEQDVARLRLVSLNGAEVLAGLSEGDVVIVAPPHTVTDGRRVTIRGRQ